jgi:hypothetical protein
MTPSTSSVRIADRKRLLESYVRWCCDHSLFPAYGCADISRVGQRPRASMTTEIEVEINLRRVNTPVKDENGYPIDNGSVRYIRRITIPALPKPGALLRLQTSTGPWVESEVARTDWDDTKAVFIVYGKYSKRSIPPEEYRALVEDPAWKMRPLL